jgi:tetratricopeptide (TPR) repeat protein
MDVRFVDRILREAVSIKLDSPVVISFSVNGGYLHPRRTENLLKLAKIIFNRSQIVIYPNNDRLPDSFNRAFRALRKSSFNIAASLFKNDDSVSLSIREHYAGHAYWRGGIEEKARRLWISALVHAPEQWETRAQLGILLSHSLQTNDRSLSRDLLMSALVERPHSYRLLLSLARLEMIDNPDKAQAYLRRAKRIRPAAVDARIFEKELYHLVN